MKRLRMIFASLLLAGTFVFAPLASVSAQTNVLDPACQNVTGPDVPTLCQDNNATKNNQTKTSNSIYGKNGIITKAVHLLSIVIGVASVLMIIIGGLRYVLSSGDSNNINGAKNTILYAVVGLVISVLAQAIIVFALSKL